MKRLNVYTETVCGVCGLHDTRDGSEPHTPPAEWSTLEVTTRHEGAGWTDNTKRLDEVICPRCTDSLLAWVGSFRAPQQAEVKP